MNTLSIRGQAATKNSSILLENFLRVQQNTYDEESNPDGILNCGVAENYLCENELIQKLQPMQIWKKNNMYYPHYSGQKQLKTALCNFFQTYFHANRQLDPDRIIISSGLTGIMSLLSYFIGDPGDVLLIASPYYTAFDHDVSAFSKCAMFGCPLLEQDNGKFLFSVEIFKNGYDEAISKGLRPCGIVILNPTNPLGDVYDEQTIQPVLEFAAEKKLHVIIDEIYALSLFENEKPFESMFNYSSIVDPLRTHFVWSLSKDFALSGLRLGVLYSGSKELCSAAGSHNFLQVPSNVVQEIAISLLSDHQWIDSYVAMNRSRLTQQYELFKEKLKAIDDRIYVRQSQAGFFIWADFRSILREVTVEEELRLFGHIFANGVYIAPGNAVSCTEPGWFRIIFSIRPTWTDEIMKRMKLGLDAYQRTAISASS